jgi:hypothetical protein
MGKVELEEYLLKALSRSGSISSSISRLSCSFLPYIYFMVTYSTWHCTKEQHEEQRATENRPTVFLPQTSRSVVAMEYFRVRITERFSSGMDDNVSSLGQWTMPPSLPKENCPAIQNKPCFDLALCRSTLLLAGQP